MDCPNPDVGSGELEEYVKLNGLNAEEILLIMSKLKVRRCAPQLLWLFPRNLLLIFLYLFLRLSCKKVEYLSRHLSRYLSMQFFWYSYWTCTWIIDKKNNHLLAYIYTCSFQILNTLKMIIYENNFILYIMFQSYS